jgi:hypothetical protein
VRKQRLHTHMLTRAAQVCTAFALLQGTIAGGATKAATAASSETGTSTRMLLQPGLCNQILNGPVFAIDLTRCCELYKLQLASLALNPLDKLE